jgi:TRAP-type C4-dicarboxylate transport system substrate-binding protein
MQRLALTSITALAVLAISVAPTAAQKTTLRFASTGPAGYAYNNKIFKPMLEEFKKASNGAIDYELHLGATLASTHNVYERVLKNVAQVAWGLQLYQRGKFPRSDVATLPLEVKNSTEGSLALWNLYADGTIAAEYDEVIPLALTVLPPSYIMSKKPIATIADIAGMKVRAAGKMPTQFVSALGAAGIFLQVSEVYQALSRGTVQATLIPWPGHLAFKLGEVTEHAYELPMGGTMGMIFMSRKYFEGLPKEHRDIILATTGRELSVKYGKFWDDEAKRARAIAAKQNKIIKQPTADEIALLKSKTQNLVDAWVKATPDGEKVLRRFRQEIAKARAAN